ncbi:ion transporter [Leptospira sp. GIMC2001]|uniref:ion transporter n=1 Tax=Leptospira sp. GIMC2001 TaxID=1513297 RepID=UPI00234B950E|nr:ion transporter [Leptospira sp. GIMC2001]WCL47879.1 ion transporter [Leptospira sp. GIMC2001]
MTLIAKKIADSPQFQGFITAVILIAGVLVGLETDHELAVDWSVLLHLADKIIISIFVIEIVIKMASFGSKPWQYFLDGWNVFDFIIVGATFLPLGEGGQYVTILRLLRLLRVLKLVRAIPKLQILVAALLKSIPSMGYVSLLLVLQFYIYGVAAVFMFGANDPVHFKNLAISMVSLFRAVTLEDWTDLMYIQMYGCENYGYGGIESICTNSSATPVLGAFFFISFVLTGTMVILNLFIGVIMNGMAEAQKENEDLDFQNASESNDPKVQLLHEVTKTKEDLAKMSTLFERLSAELKK